MKQLIGTFVLFALLFLTVIAITNVSDGDPSATPAAARMGEVQNPEN